MSNRSNILRRRIKRWLVYAGWAVVVVAKASFLFVTGCRKLQVDKVLVNDAFLLSNGLLALRWKAKRLLWVTVQGKWVGGRANQMMVFAPGAATVLSIRLRGLFSSCTRCFSVVPVAGLEVRKPSVSGIMAPPSADKLYPVLTGGSALFTIAVGRSIALYFVPVEFDIPPVQTDNRDDKRKL